MAKIDKLDAYYETVASTYNDMRLDRGQEILNVVNLVRRLAPPGSVLAEVGCGTARHSEALIALGYTAIGVDMRFAPLSAAPKKSVYLVNGLAENLPLRSGRVCGVIFILVLHQLTPAQIANALREASRVLISGGFVLIKTTAPQDLHKRTFVKYFPSGLRINLDRYPSIDALMAAAASSGLILAERVDTITEDVRPKSDVLAAITGKHNSTLALLPEDEFLSGLQSLQDATAALTEITISHYHTLLVLTKS